MDDNSVMQGSVDGQRLFFALWPPPEIQQQMHQVGRLALGRHSGKLVPSESLHLTLAFLGAMPDELVAAAIDVADDNVWTTVGLVFDRIGWFRRARVLWAGCSEIPDGLINYVERLQRGLAAAGIPVDARPFRPHVTLARKVRRPPVVREMEAFGCTFAQLHLARTVTTGAGSRYEIVRSWPVADESGETGIRK